MRFLKLLVEPKKWAGNHTAGWQSPRSFLDFSRRSGIGGFGDWFSIRINHSAGLPTQSRKLPMEPGWRAWASRVPTLVANEWLL